MLANLDPHPDLLKTSDHFSENVIQIHWELFSYLAHGQTNTGKNTRKPTINNREGESKGWMSVKVPDFYKPPNYEISWCGSCSIFTILSSKTKWQTGDQYLLVALYWYLFHTEYKQESHTCNIELFLFFYRQKWPTHSYKPFFFCSKALSIFSICFKTKKKLLFWWFERPESTENERFQPHLDAKKKKKLLNKYLG